jgi:hypothetical protein
LVPDFAGRSEMLKRKRLVIFTIIILALCLAPASNAAYFIFNKKGNIRSGPGTKYRVIGQLAKETIAKIPDSFTDYDATWIAIDAKTGYDKKTKSQKVVYTKWVNKSIGAIVKGDIDDVEKYLAIKESGWPEEIQELILAGKVEAGMTTHMVFYAWGKPDAINESPTSNGTKEEWLYKRSGEKKRYLYFEDGLLTEIKN